MSRDSDKARVLSVWPDAEVSTAFAVQPDKSRRWMYCVMSSLKFRASRGKKRVLNIGPWKFSEDEAWAGAAARVFESRARDLGGE